MSTLVHTGEGSSGPTMPATIHPRAHPPPGVERLAILGEKNDGGANERATRDCARRWKAEGAEVKWIEPMTGDDANDVLLAGRAE